MRVITLWFKKADLWLEAKFERILPASLKTRYFLGLCLVAGLAVAGQLGIQITLYEQSALQNEIRILETSIRHSSNLKNAVLAFELSSNVREGRGKFVAVRDTWNMLNAELKGLEWVPADQIRSLKTRAESLHEKIVKIDSVVSSPSRAALRQSMADRGLVEVSELFLEEFVPFDRLLKESWRLLAEQSRSRIARFKYVEFTLMLFTLFILFIEGMYVFRPAVRNLNEAVKAKADFYSRMSHEIRNPMNAVIGMANLLSESPLNAQQKRLVEILGRSGRSLLDLLNHLLDFSKIEAGKIDIEMASFDLYELIERVTDLAAIGAHASGIELVLDIDSNAPLRVKGDAVRLGQVLSNLVGNAIKFTPSGHVLISLAWIKVGEKRIYRFTVSDTGVGINPRKIATIFEPFVQEDSSIKRRFGGSGLGLTISRELLRKMGSEIEVKSTEGMGSTFSFDIELEPEAETALRETTIHSMIEKRIGFIPPFRATLIKRHGLGSDVIERTVMQCSRTDSREAFVTIGDINAALPILKSALMEDDSMHLLLIDFSFIKPEWDELIVFLNRYSPDLNRIVMLMRTTSSSQDLETCAHLGIKNILFKPLKPLAMLEMVESALAPVGISSIQVVPSFGSHSEEAVEAGKKWDLDHPFRVLACDDSNDNLMLIGLYLSALPHCISFASDGKAAVRKFKEGRFDIVFMDLQMPEMDGYDATREIRQWERLNQLPVTPVISISAHLPSDHPEKYNSSGFTDHLLKPLDPRKLKSMIQSHLKTEKSFPKSTPEPGQGDDSQKDASYDKIIKDVQDAVARLRPKYVESRRKELAELKQLLKANEFAPIKGMGHKLKGNAKSYGFPKLSELGEQLEKAAAAGDATEVTRWISEIEKEVDGIKLES